MPHSDPPPFDPDLVFQAFPVLWFHFDESNIYRNFKANSGQQLYVQPENFLGLSAEVPFLGAFGGTALRAIDEARSSETPIHLEYSLDLPNGRRDFEARFMADARGWVSCFITDISIQKRYERRLEEREKRFRRLVAAGWDIIVLTDSAGKILDVSPSVTRVLGGAEQDIVGRNAVDIVPRDERHTVEEALRRVVAGTDSPTTMVTRTRHKNGQWRWMESSLTNHIADEDLGCLVVNSRDLTERRNLEERLRAAQRLEELGRLAGGIAHDFNNILTVILGYSEVLAAEATGRGETQTANDLHEVMSAGKRGRELTRRLLAFARRQVLAPRIFDVNAHIHELEVMLRRLLGDGIRLEFELEDEPLRVTADPGQLEQCLLNLAVNARDAMPNGGIFLIRSSLAKGPDGITYVGLDATDTGVGIPGDILEQIFEPFFTTKPTGKGTGLGLPTVRSILDQLGGAVEVTSNVGAGTTFHLRMPLAVGNIDKARNSDIIPAETSAAVRVLVVDDEEAVRVMMARALRFAGHDVTECVDGTDALAVATSASPPFDAIVSDVAMPGMSGPALAKAIRATYPRTAVLLVSGYTAEFAVNETLMAPNSAFLPKPLTPVGLRAALHTLLASHHALQRGAGI